VSGSVVANGAGGASGCVLPQPGEAGRLDTIPAVGGEPCDPSGARGGNGGAGSIAAGNGVSIDQSGISFLAQAGHGGGGVGRIRINTAPGGFHRAGLFSPNPSTGNIATC
jgi:hypothetical protein